MLKEQSLIDVMGQASLLVFFTLCVSAAAIADESDKQPGSDQAMVAVIDKGDFFAHVGEQTLSKQDYLAKLRYEIRQKFFHAKVPEKQMEKFRETVGRQLVNRTLLIQEAKRQGIKPDEAAIKNKITRLEDRKKNDPYWQKNQKRLLPGVREQYENDSLLKLIEKKIRDVPEPSEKELRAYFKANPEKFTIPERLRVATILLKVDPSSGGEVWRAATDEAGKLVTQLREGADFAELARIHSSHDSAASGGDMGYVHKGMLAKPAQEIIDLMDSGDISEPIIILQGVAIFRLDDRVKSSLNSFDRIRDTANGLVKRENGNAAWIELVKRLRVETKIEVNESVYKLAAEQAEK